MICFAHGQNIYQEMIQAVKQRDPEVEIHLFNNYPEKELSNPDFLKTPLGTQSLILIDDLSSEVKGSFVKLLRGGCHHDSVTCIYISQCFTGESKLAKIGLKNLQYIFLTRSAESGPLLVDLNKRLFMYKKQFLSRAYEKVMSKAAYAYLCIDLSVQCENRNRVKTGFFPGENAFIYRSE